MSAAATVPSPTPHWPGVRALAAVVVALGLGVFLLLGGHITDIPHHQWIHPLAVGYALIAAGLIAWTRRPDNRTGPLMVVAGLLYFLPALQSGSRIPIVYTVGSALASAPVPALVYLTLAFPRGRLTTTWDRVLFGFALFEAFFSDTLFAPWFDPTNPVYGCTDCQRGLNLLLVHDDDELVNGMYWVNQRFVIALGVLFGLTLLHRLWRASGPKRSVVGPLYLAMSAWGLVTATRSTARLLHVLKRLSAPQWSATTMTLLLLATLSFLLGLLRTRMRRARVGELAIDLGETTDRETVRDKVARVLGDPSVEVGYWVADANGYLTPEGQPVDLPAPESGRAVQYVQRGNAPLAVIVHDDAVLDDPIFVDRVVATLALSLDNERLQAEVQAQLAEVRASRARIVEAGYTERRRVERDLHDGAQQRLLTLGVALRRAIRQIGVDPQKARNIMQEAASELDAALDELRELARGIHPPILTEEGLAPAVEALADRCPVPAVVEATTDERLPTPVETTAYFVVSEALANIVKYADASTARIRMTRENGHLCVEVTDDGVGGADPAAGSGLRGLQDRVAAVGGRLVLDSPPGRGTRLAVDIPCE